MSYSVSTKLGNIQAGEIDWLFTPSNVRAGRAGVILIHGASTPDHFIGQGWPAANKLAAALANAGIACVSGYLGTNSTNTADPWCNDTHLARIDSALTYLATSGVTATKVHLFGISMGGGAAFRWAGTNPTKAASITGVIPMSNINYHYQNNSPAGAQAGIGTAWGVTFPTALPAGADLVGGYAPAIKSAGIPVNTYYSTIDAYVQPSDVLALTSAAGGQSYAIDSSVGHANGTLAKFDVNAYISFLKANGA